MKFTVERFADKCTEQRGNLLVLTSKFHILCSKALFILVNSGDVLLHPTFDLSMTSNINDDTSKYFWSVPQYLHKKFQTPCTFSDICVNAILLIDLHWHFNLIISNQIKLWKSDYFSRKVNSREHRKYTYLLCMI